MACVVPMMGSIRKLCLTDSILHYSSNEGACMNAMRIVKVVFGLTICQMVLIGCGRTGSSASSSMTEATVETSAVADTEADQTVDDVAEPENSENAEVRAFLDEFEDAWKSRSLESIVNCLEPDVSERFLGIYKQKELDADTATCIYPYFKDALGLNGDIPYNYIGNYEIVDEEISISGDNADVSYTLNRKFDDGSGSPISAKASLTKIDGKWYIPADIEQIQKGDHWPALYKPVNITDADVEGNLYTIISGKKYGYINGYGKEILPPSYDRMGLFGDGYCPVYQNDFGWGFIRKNGELAVYYSFKDVANMCVDGYWPVRMEDNKWHFYNPDTGDLTGYCCDEIQSRASYAWNENLRPGNLMPDWEVFRVIKNGKVGAYNPAKNIDIPCIYDEMELFKDGLCVATKDGYKGVLNLAGETVVDHLYDDADKEYINGRLAVRINYSNWGVIDENGSYIIEVKKGQQVEVSESGLILANDVIYDHDGNPIIDNVLSWEGTRCKDGVVARVHLTDDSERYEHVHPDTAVTYVPINASGAIVYNILEDCLANNDLIEYNDNDYLNLKLVKPYGGNKTYEGFSVLLQYGESYYGNIIDFSGKSVSNGWFKTSFGDPRVYEEGYYVNRNCLYGFGMGLIDENDSMSYEDVIELNGNIVFYGGSVGNVSKIYGSDSGIFETGYLTGDNAVILYDGIYYGLYTNDGFAGEGVAYTKIDYDADADLFTLEKGANFEYYRVARDGDHKPVKSVKGEALDTNTDRDAIWSKALFEMPSTEFNVELALVAAMMSQEAADETGDKIKSLYGQYNISEVMPFNYGGDAAFSIAQGSLEDGGEDTTILVVSCRGSTTAFEYMGDLFKGFGFDKTDTFLGKETWNNVYDFEEKVWQGLNEYLEKYPSLKTTDKIKVLVNGHSLGGAAACMVGARLDDDIKNGNCFNNNLKSEDVYVYTFGAIKVLDSDDNVSDGYENIHNIYNYYDAYGPHGNMSMFNASSPDAKFGHTDLFYLDKEKDGLSDYNHWMSTYIEALKSERSTEQFGGEFVHRSCN